MAHLQGVLAARISPAESGPAPVQIDENLRRLVFIRIQEGGDVQEMLSSRARGEIVLLKMK